MKGTAIRAAGSSRPPGAPAGRTLDEQWAEFRRRRFVAMPVAGAVVWTLIGVAGATLPPVGQVWALFIGTGSIVWVGILVSRLTGENLADRSGPKNTFDTLFFLAMGQALLVFAVAIPFFRADYTSLPLSVGILTGLMWMPVTWLIGHWIGVFHAVARTVSVVAAWYALPDLRFVAIPAAIVVVYLVTIVVLEDRWRRVRSA